MPRDTLLFWGVYLAFFLGGNVVRLGPLADTVALRARGRFAFRARRRLALGSREAVFSNPLNLFDLIVASAGQGAELPAAAYRRDRRLLRPLAGWCGALAWNGYACLAVTALLAAASVALGFAAVALPLLAAHLACWAAMAWLCHRAWAELSPPPPGKWAFILEALLVPAHVINAGKRLCALVRVETPALALALRQLPRAADEERELLAYALAGRLQELQYHARTEAELQGIRRLKACLPD